MIKIIPFWRRWKNLDVFEKAGIMLINDFVEKIVKKHSKQLCCILAHGSFVRREWGKQSDIDLKVVVNKKADIATVEKSIHHYSKSKYHELLEAKIYSLESLESGIRDKEGMMNPSRFVKLSENYHLLWGNKLPYQKLVHGTSYNHLVNMIKFVLGFQHKKINNLDLAKLYLSVIHWENLHKGSSGDMSYRKIKKQYSKHQNSVAYKASLVRESLGNKSPKNFQKDVFKNLKIKLKKLQSAQ
jgi:predicted nucleotidyltransferase